MVISIKQTVSDLSSGIEKMDWSAVRSKQASGHYGSKFGKYLEFDRWLSYNARICRELGLAAAPKGSLLDIGCGAGLLLYCAQHFGHEAVGVDKPDALFVDMAKTLGVDRREAMVYANEPLDAPEGPFDWVTCVATAFDRQRVQEGDEQVWTYWGVPEWTYFLEEVKRRMTPTGVLYLRVNKPNDSRFFYDDAVAEYLLNLSSRSEGREFWIPSARL